VRNLRESQHCEIGFIHKTWQKLSLQMDLTCDFPNWSIGAHITLLVSDFKGLWVFEMDLTGSTLSLKSSRTKGSEGLTLLISASSDTLDNRPASI
jgi:hypothetical protein